MPTGLLTALVIGGIGLGAAGMIQQSKASSQMKDAQNQEIQQQQAIAAQQKQQAELEYHRQQMQIVRNQNKARSMSLATATGQGAQFGSVLPGAFGGIQGQGGNQELGLDQNYQIGNNIYGINQQMSQSRIDYSNASSDFRAGQGLSSLGGSVISGAGQLSSIGQSSFAAFQRGMSFGTGPGARYS